MSSHVLSAANSWSLWWRKIPVAGHSMRATSLDRLLYLMLHAAGLMGRAERVFFGSIVQPGMTVVDVGANLGIYTLLFARLVGPKGTVIAFEPEPRLFRALRENCAGLSNVRLINAAVGAAAGRGMLMRGSLNSGNNSLLGIDASKGQPNAGCLVNVVALDQVVNNDIDFIKVDVQGNEWDVFLGMRRLLGRVPLFFEFWPSGLHRAGTDPAFLVDSLLKAGYRLREVGRDQKGAAVDLPRLVVRLGKHGYTNLYATPW